MCALEVSKKLKLYKYRVARYVEPKLNKFAKKAMSVQLSRKIALSVKCT